MMGSPENEKDRKVDETRHEVTFTKGFYLGKFELTQAQWRKVMETNPSEFKGDDQPVEMVSWSDAMEFCRKLTELERAAGRIPDGWKYTLPTEAQWEYACRAGTTTVYAFGNKITTKQANFDKALGKTTIVGKYLANAWGVHDMHGNVRELCLDWLKAFAKVSVRDPQVSAVGTQRVSRGGGWRDGGGNVRSAARIGYLPDYRSNHLGFRLCLSQTQAPKASGQPKQPIREATEAKAREAIQTQYRKLVESIIANRPQEFESLVDSRSKAKPAQVLVQWTAMRSIVSLVKLKKEDFRIDEITFNPELTRASVRTSHREFGNWKRDAGALTCIIENGEWRWKLTNP